MQLYMWYNYLHIGVMCAPKMALKCWYVMDMVIYHGGIYHRGI